MLSVIARPATRAVAISGVRGAGDCFPLDKLGVAMTRVSMLDARYICGAKDEERRTTDETNQQRKGIGCLSPRVRYCNGDIRDIEEFPERRKIFPDRYIDGAAFEKLDERYEHVFAMLATMERKSASFCKAQ